ncbi:MAG: hypothetical protein RIS75_703 [Actinomycetota bacterium]
MRIDVWSDVVCPWCYIGFTRLDKAIALSGMEVEVYHHAFQLDPNAGPETMPAVENLAQKYGIAPEDALGMMNQVVEVAAADGLDYHLAETLHGNTLFAHKLLAYAATQGVQHELLVRLFNAYFEQARSVFTVEALLPHAIAVGLDEAESVAAMTSDIFAEVIAYDKAVADQIGVRGVPFFVFNQRLAVPGAESVEALVEAMQQAEAETAAAQAESESQ